MKRRDSSGGSRVVLPVTPMLDMTFQLLFFFIINFNPADQEGLLDMALAPVKGGAGPGVQVEPPANPGLEPADVIVSVRAGHGEDAGDISAIAVEAGHGNPVFVEGG